MKVAILQFPGSNCDWDAEHAVKDVLGLPAQRVWHKDPLPSETEAVIVPGGFSFGDYLRCGAIARFSPITADLKRFAGQGGAGFGNLQRLSDSLRGGSATRCPDSQRLYRVSLCQPTLEGGRLQRPISFIQARCHTLSAHCSWGGELPGQGINPSRVGIQSTGFAPLPGQS